MSKDYRDPEDFLSDDSFLSWYFGSGRDGSGFWDRWTAGDAGRQELVARAVAMLDAARLREKGVSPSELQLAEATMLRRISAVEIKGRFDWRWIAAACILFLLISGMIALRLKPGGQQLATGNGEVTVKALPDGSEVTMNANSRLRYASNWRDGSDREVWIDGEAFFHVQKTSRRSRFIVHTGQFDVIVTGTRFDVVSKSGRNNVLLQEGSVIIHPRAGIDMDMIPGDFVSWDGNNLRKTSVRNDSVLAWRQHQFIFDRTPLSKVVDIIKDQYGVSVKLDGPGIADSSISGIMRNDNLDVFLQALESTSDFDVIRSNGEITIKLTEH
jgi:ferric-dicitrate binding protein FerR (iron transport regulator)